MSDINIDPSNQSAPETSQGQAVGSPPESGSPPTSEVEQGTSSEGVEPAEGVAEQKAPVNDEVKGLRQKLTEQGEQIAGFTDLFNLLKADPELWGRIEKRVRGDEAPVDPVAAALSKVDQVFEDDTARALKPILAEYEKAIEQKLLAKLSPFLRDASQTALESRQIAGLKKAGLDPAVAQTDEYRAFMREQQLEKPWLKSVLREDPVSAHELIGKAYAEANGLRRQIHNEAARREGVKLAASMEQRGGKAGPTVSTAMSRKIPRDQNALRNIMEQLKQGVDPGAIDLV